ncbi:MAG: hypothetical protein P8Y23_16120 [Candidatus Lokiarchaeota archaeon]
MTKKVGLSGQFGPRYGANVRKQWALIMNKQKGGKLKCPRCETKGSITRESTGIWFCKKCKDKSLIFTVQSNDITAFRANVNEIISFGKVVDQSIYISENF